ncbi:MAG: NAD(P)(+) transhydrogenase (Re/Si-specific) subunit beta [Planctomycetaceae bacterium]
MSPFARDLLYLAAAACLILGLRRLSSVKTARQGNALAAGGMLLALVVALLDAGIVGYGGIAAGLVAGSLVGTVLARRLPMTAMPELVALLNGFGGGASALVATAEFFTPGRGEATGELVAISLGLLIGTVTFTGSLVAFGKLRGLVASRPVTYPLQRTLNLLLFLGVLAACAAVIAEPGRQAVYAAALAAAALLGVTLVLPIGGGDMPVVISLLNSYSGIAASMAGFVLGDRLLIVGGALVGASGILLTQLMCKAMNRSLTNVCFGAFGKIEAREGGGEGGPRTVREFSAEDAAIAMAGAQLVVIVPGYGLAVARAQHDLRELADLLAKRGVEVKYAIHPVAGRMPGHMNVLLAEADVPYAELHELEQVNPDFPRADVALVVGANDVVNPAARSDRASPIFGMPVLDADKARVCIVMKRSMAAGFAGIDNPLFYLPNTRMLFGDAKASLSALVGAVKTS